jgi:hypothetical protein
MNQALYAHVNNKRKRKIKTNKQTKIPNTHEHITVKAVSMMQNKKRISKAIRQKQEVKIKSNSS